MTLTWLVIWAVILIALGLVLYYSVLKLPDASKKREINEFEDSEEKDELHLSRGKGLRVKSVNFKDEFSSALSFEPDLNQHELPWGYGDSKIVLLTKDPHWLFAYWEITDEKRSELKNHHGEEIFSNSQPVLRLYEIKEDSDTNYMDIEINDHARDWYINVQPNGAYKVALGRKTEKGVFISLLESNPAMAPRENMSEKVDEKWPPIPGVSQYYGNFGFDETLSSEVAVRKD